MNYWTLSSASIPGLVLPEDAFLVQALNAAKAYFLSLLFLWFFAHHCLHIIGGFWCEHFGVWVEVAGSQDLCPQPDQDVVVWKHFHFISEILDVVLKHFNFISEILDVVLKHFRFIPETDNLQVVGKDLIHVSSRSMMNVKKSSQCLSEVKEAWPSLFCLQVARKMIY